MQTHHFSSRPGLCQFHMCAQPRPVLRYDSPVVGRNRPGFYRLALSVATALPTSDSLFALKRDGPRPLSGPSNPDLGPIEGVTGCVALPRSGLRGGTCDPMMPSRAAWLIHASQELSGARVISTDPGSTARWTVSASPDCACATAKQNHIEINRNRLTLSGFMSVPFFAQSHTKPVMTMQRQDVALRHIPFPLFRVCLQSEQRPLPSGSGDNSRDHSSPDR